MTDVHDKKTRSFNMSRIRSKDTKPEMIVRKFLYAKGFRYRLHDKKLPGKPDIVLPKYKTVIFVNGCFWHGHRGCKYFVIPKTRTEWWVKKITDNIQRDIKNSKLLKKQGYLVLEIYECILKSGYKNRTLINLSKKIQSNARKDKIYTSCI
jgi:DNA mismatch endonuclease (patch repair protein)